VQHLNNSLPGHTDHVWCVAWSPIDEYLLASGSVDNTVRLWDIRRSGASACLHSFDQHQTHDTTTASMAGKQRATTMYDA
jgi:DNA excision repair protein ERCC-8